MHVYGCNIMVSLEKRMPKNSTVGTFGHQVSESWLRNKHSADDGKRTPKDFTIGNFGHPVTKSWLRHKPLADRVDVGALSDTHSHSIVLARIKN